MNRSSGVEVDRELWVTRGATRKQILRVGSFASWCILDLNDSIGITMRLSVLAGPADRLISIGTAAPGSMNANTGLTLYRALSDVFTLMAILASVGLATLCVDEPLKIKSDAGHPDASDATYNVNLR